MCDIAQFTKVKPTIQTCYRSPLIFRNLLQLLKTLVLLLNNLLENVNEISQWTHQEYVRALHMYMVAVVFVGVSLG